jgi:hypothetical protein
MQDRKGSDPGYWYLAPVPHSHTSNLNKALLLHPFLILGYERANFWRASREVKRQ